MSDTPAEYQTTTVPAPLADFLYPAPAERRPGAIVRWWESRRLKYNVIVGGAGLATLGMFGATALVITGSLPTGFPWMAVGMYGVLANICYSLGAPIEIVVEKLWGRSVLPIGPFLFRSGLTLSIGLTLVIPMILAGIGTIISILGRVF